LEEEIPKRLVHAEDTGLNPAQRGATWTYLITDMPFGTIQERITAGLRKKLGLKDV
jgi:hypothetical protein